jgi:DNA polymerase-4
MEESLAKLGIATIGDLATRKAEALSRRLGTHGHDLVLLARGVDERPVLSEAGGAKSLGQEHTYGEDTADLEQLRRTLFDLADAVAARLRGHRLRARTVTLKYRDAAFRTLTRAESSATPTDSGEALFRIAWRLFEGVHRGNEVRLLGIYASGFGGTEQLDLFAPEASPADRLRDTVADRFGDGLLTRASLLARAGRTGVSPPSGARGRK